MASALDGTLFCTWLDLRSKGTKLYCSISKDGGATWSANKLVYESPWGTICQCCHPSAVFDPKGKLYVMFRNALDGNRDMYLVESANGSTSFGSAVKLGGGTWPIEACPMDGGMLAAGKDGAPTVWRRENELFECLAKGQEKPMGVGKQPWIALGSDGAYQVWMFQGGIASRNPLGGRVMLAELGDDPVVCASANGKVVVAAWTQAGIQAAVLKRD